MMARIEERLFMGRVGDEKVTNSHESHRAASEVRPPVALVGKGNEALDVS
jgi:hypothetical protein